MAEATTVRNETTALLSCESRERIGVAGTVYGVVWACQLCLTTGIVGSRTYGVGELLSLPDLIRFVEVVWGVFIFIPVTFYFDNGAAFETRGFQFLHDRFPRTLVCECFSVVFQGWPFDNGLHCVDYLINSLRLFLIPHLRGGILDAAEVNQPRALHLARATRQEFFRQLYRTPFTACWKHLR